MKVKKEVPGLKAKRLENLLVAKIKEAYNEDDDLFACMLRIRKEDSYLMISLIDIEPLTKILDGELPEESDVQDVKSESQIIITDVVASSEGNMELN